MLRAFAVFIVLVCTAACSSQGQPMKEVKLTSGRVVQVIAVGRISVSNKTARGAVPIIDQNRRKSRTLKTSVEFCSSARPTG